MLAYTGKQKCVCFRKSKLRIRTEGVFSPPLPFLFPFLYQEYSGVLVSCWINPGLI